MNRNKQQKSNLFSRIGKKEETLVDSCALIESYIEKVEDRIGGGRRVEEIFSSLEECFAKFGLSDNKRTHLSNKNPRKRVLRTEKPSLVAVSSSKSFEQEKTRK